MLILIKNTKKKPKNKMNSNKFISSGSVSNRNTFSSFHNDFKEIMKAASTKSIIYKSLERKKQEIKHNEFSNYKIKETNMNYKRQS